MVHKGQSHDVTSAYCLLHRAVNPQVCPFPLFLLEPFMSRNKMHSRHGTTLFLLHKWERFRQKLGGTVGPQQSFVQRPIDATGSLMLPSGLFISTEHRLQLPQLARCNSLQSSLCTRFAKWDEHKMGGLSLTI